MSKTSFPLVSVIITTKNEEKNIQNCLESILSQTYKNTEIIVVDNNSTDKTFAIAQKYTKNVFNLKKNDNIKNFRGAQVNQGVECSKGDIIFFPDADMTFSKDLLKDIVRKIEHNDALYIPEIVIGKGLFGKIRNFERSFYNGTVIDGIRVVKRNIFKQVNGFDVENIVFGPDDWDFTKTIKNFTDKISVTDECLFHHEENLDIKSYLRKKTNYLHTFESYINKWGTDDKDIKKQFGIYYRYFGVFVENGKWKRLTNIKELFLFVLLILLRFIIGLKYFFKIYKKS